MLQSKSQYQRKIDELHQKIEEAAIELQHTREEIESEKKGRNVIRESIEGLKDDIADKKRILSEVATETEDWRKTRKREVLSYEKEVDSLKSQVVSLEKEKAGLEKEIEGLGSVERDINRKVDGLARLDADITGLKTSKAELSKELSILETKELGEKEAIEKMRGKADKIIESATLTARDAHKFYNSIGPWISAIAQWHAVHGGEMPELLHDWKPKAIVVSSEIHKKLKDKQI